MITLLHELAARDDVLRLACLTPADVDHDALARRFADWQRVNGGALHYLDSRRDVLLDPFGQRPWAQAALVVAFAPRPDPASPLRRLPPARPCQPAAWIAPYALQEDYHRTGQRLLKSMMDHLGRFFPDVARPVLEKMLAQQAGVGFRAPNGLLRVPPWACQAHLAILFTSLPLPALMPPPPTPTPDQHPCPTCQACVDACPNRALTAGGFLVRRCRAWIANEKRGPLSPEEETLLGNALFGCPFCTNACPDTPPGPEPLAVDPDAVCSLANAELKRMIAGTALQHLGPNQLKRNARAAISNHKPAVRISLWHK